MCCYSTGSQTVKVPHTGDPLKRIGKLSIELFMFVVSCVNSICVNSICVISICVDSIYLYKVSICVSYKSIYFKFNCYFEYP